MTEPPVMPLINLHFPSILAGRSMSASTAVEASIAATSVSDLPNMNCPQFSGGSFAQQGSHHVEVAEVYPRGDRVRGTHDLRRKGPVPAAGTAAFSAIANLIDPAEAIPPPGPSRRQFGADVGPGASRRGERPAPAGVRIVKHDCRVVGGPFRTVAFAVERDAFGRAWTPAGAPIAYRGADRNGQTGLDRRLATNVLNRLTSLFSQRRRRGARQSAASVSRRRCAASSCAAAT